MTPTGRHGLSQRICSMNIRGFTVANPFSSCFRFEVNYRERSDRLSNRWSPWHSYLRQSGT